LRTADRDDGDTLCVEIPAATLCERFERALVADPFDEDDGTRRVPHDALGTTEESREE
jgi:hypothetical protein